MKGSRSTSDSAADDSMSTASTPSWASVRPPSILGGVRFLLVEADLLLTVASGVAALAAFLALDGTPPRTRLYFPDNGRWQPFTEESIPVRDVVFVLLLGILPGIAAVEVALARGIRRAPWPLALLAAWRYVAAYGSSLAMTGFFLEVAWASLGWLRPDFASRCLGNGPYAPGQFVNSVVRSNADCTTGATEEFLNVGRRAFPSGHSAGAAVGGVWATAVLLRAAGSGIGGLLAQAAVAGIYGVWLWVGHVALSRVIENRHTVADVSGGLALGAIVGGVSAYWVSGAVARLEAKLSGAPDGGGGRRAPRGRGAPQRRGEDGEGTASSLSTVDGGAPVDGEGEALAGITASSALYDEAPEGLAPPAADDGSLRSSAVDVEAGRRRGGRGGPRGDVAIAL